MHKVLFVDDEENILSSIKRLFYRKKDLEIFTALSGQEGLKILEQNKINLIVSDLKMPEMSGIEFLKVVKEKYPDSYRILLTGYADINETIEAVNKGQIFRFIKKPWETIELKKTIDEVLEYIELKKINKQMNKLINEQNKKLKELNSNLEGKIRIKTERIKSIQNVTIFVLARLAESRDIETGKHLDRMREYSLFITKKLSEVGEYSNYIDKNYIENIYCSSPLHDIGKVGIPDDILLKPGKLTEKEFEIMKTHTIIGGKTLEDAEKRLKRKGTKKSFLSMGRNIAYYHHEGWDGNGYPFGLKGDNIPLSARIVSLADVYDALTTKRVYKDALSHEKAIEIILSENGKKFDPIIIEIFKKYVDVFREISSKYK